MKATYGKDFAILYNRNWASFGKKMWPFLKKTAAGINPKDSSWLDLCCGTGSLLALVSDAGFRAMGVDISPHQLKHAKKNAPKAILIREDIRKIDLPDRFDVITCLYDSLNYLTVQKDLAIVFRKVKKQLAPGGVFVFDINTREGLERNWNRAWTIRDRRALIVMEGSFDAKTSIGKTVITGFIPDGNLYRKFEEVHIQQGYRAPEIEELLAKAGFAFRKYDGKQFGRARKLSGRLVYVCRVK